jgi:hypothetical protein
LDPHLDCLLEKKGLDNGEIKKVAIQQFFMKKDIDPEITFKQLFELTNKKINFIAANLTLNKLEILNYETYPDMEVWKGLLITTALPFLYEPIHYNEQYLVDGGIFDNYPIQLFNDDSIIGINMINDINNIDLNIDFLNYCTKMIELTYNWHVTHKIEQYKKYTIEIKTHNALELINTEKILASDIPDFYHTKIIILSLLFYQIEGTDVIILKFLFFFNTINILVVIFILLL